MVGARLAAAASPDEAASNLAEQNRKLQLQVLEQQRVIEELASKMGELLKVSERHERELVDLRARTDETPAQSMASYQRDKEVRISGELAFGILKSGSAGEFEKSTFRVDDAKIAVEAPIMRDVYFYGELLTATRESENIAFQPGEFYLDFENVSGRLGGSDRFLSIRAGQFYTPFGEEYSVRGPMRNPLISHSLSDVWGIDGGVEAYGQLGAWRYAVAVQNGSSDLLYDDNADKAIAARVAWTPTGWLNLSASVMRTGELKAYAANAGGYRVSNLWFGNGFFRALGPESTTGTFSAKLWETDASVQWKGGHGTVALGGAHYSDNDRVSDNSRRIGYGYIEAVQDVTTDFYLAARYSGINAPRGYPLVGWGDMGKYLFSPLLTRDITRLSMGFGYRFGAPLVLKFDYTLESGRLTNGSDRKHEDFIGAEAAIKF